MISAGVAQLQERQRSTLQVAGANPAPRSSILQAFAAGLWVEPVAREAGRSDGLRGERWQPRHFDVFSYASGYFEGELHRPRHGGRAC